MVTDKDFNDLFLNNMNSNNISTKNMMGEYIIYYDSVVIGGLYDNQLLVKATKSALNNLQGYSLVSPYPNAKEMILIPEFTKRINFTNLFENIKNDLEKEN
ncbi:TfoX/Sxy family protein [Mammaliicoccus sciuri]|uniref:TfoX/Sxy family protein n=1 Tax=Mammaliicoccus sciuri TaxID=1296 RepID=UPI003CC63BBE